MSSTDGSFSVGGGSDRFTAPGDAPRLNDSIALLPGSRQVFEDVVSMVSVEETKLASIAKTDFELKLATLIDIIDEFNDKSEEKSHIARRLNDQDKKRIEDALDALKQEVRRPGLETTTLDIAVGRREIREIRKEYEELVKAQNKILELIAYGAECSKVAIKAKKDEASKAIAHLNDQFKTAVHYIITGNNGRQEGGIGDLITKYKNGEEIVHGKFVEALRHAVVSITKLAHAFAEKLQHIVKKAGLKISEKVSEGLAKVAEFRGHLATHKAFSLNEEIDEIKASIAELKDTAPFFDELEGLRKQMQAAVKKDPAKVSGYLQNVEAITRNHQEDNTKKLASLEKKLKKLENALDSTAQKAGKLFDSADRHRSGAEAKRGEASMEDPRHKTATAKGPQHKESRAFDDFEMPSSPAITPAAPAVGGGAAAAAAAAAEAAAAAAEAGSGRPGRPTIGGFSDDDLSDGEDTGPDGTETPRSPTRPGRGGH